MMSDHMKSEPMLISKLLALRVESMDRDTLAAIAMAPGRSPGFLRSVAALLRERSALDETAGRAIRDDARVMLAPIARSLSGSSASADAFLSMVADAMTTPDSQLRVRRPSPAETLQRLETAAGLPNGAFTGETAKRVAVRMLLFYRRQAGRLADAADKGLAAVADFDSERQSWQAGERVSPPEAFLGTLLIPSLEVYPTTLHKNGNLSPQARRSSRRSPGATAKSANGSTPTASPTRSPGSTTASTSRLPASRLPAATSTSAWAGRARTRSFRDGLAAGRKGARVNRSRAVFVSR